MASSASTAGPTPLGQLLSETFSYCKAHVVPLVAGVVVFGVLSGFLGAYAASTVQRSVGGMMNGMGVDVNRMQELSARMEAGDESAMAELEEMLADGPGKMDEAVAAQKAMGMMTTLLPVVGFAGIISLLLGFLANAYYALIAVEGKDLNATLARVPGVILPLAGVSVWSFLRSFAWIPLIGIIPAIILGPRFVAAPLVYLTEGKGVMASVSSSYARTSGYWGKIIGNVIVAGLIAFVVSMVAGMILGAVLFAIPSLMIIVQKIVGQAMVAFLTVFVVRLASTVLQHPRS